MKRGKITFHNTADFDDLLRKKRQLKRRIAYKEEEIVEQVLAPLETITAIIGSVKNAATFLPMGISIGKLVARFFKRR